MKVNLKMENPARKEEDNHHHTHGHIHHKHIHNQAEKKAVINRLSKVVGHIEAIKRMVENDLDCNQVLIQLAAVRAAINNTGNLVLKNHISHCIVEAAHQGDDQAIKDLNNAIDRFLK
jgi:CsoR family transcriptional regulator, copper-sensing transcriptional repressor